MAKIVSDLDSKAEVGKEEGFHEIVDRYGNDLYRVAVSLLGHPDDAEDILQDTFIAAYERLSKFEGRSTLKTWLIGILLRKIAQHRRYSKVRQTISLHWLGGQDRVHVERGAIQRPQRETQFRLDLESMLNSLSGKHREILLLREILGLSYEEIGEALRIPAGTVESRLFRARQEIRKQFKDYIVD